MAIPIDNIRADRIKKLEALKTLGVNPYPSTVNRTHTVNSVINDFANLEKSAEKVSLAGRIMSLRKHGGMAFMDLVDESNRIQIFISKKDVGEAQFEIFKLLDMGDFIEITGPAFSTQSGEKTIKAENLKLLAKSIRPIPDEHFGLKDEEKRYRLRYLDLLLNKDRKDMFKRKALFWQSAAKFFIERDFTQVFTPSMEAAPAGADATPFKTHLNALDIDLYLRICMGEIWQKKLMVAGYEKTFEIGYEYRNEGVSPEHAQEFMDLEFYWAYANYKDGMKLVREFYIYLAKQVYGRTKFVINGEEIELDQEWPEIDYHQEILKKTGLDIFKASTEDIKKKLEELGVKFEDSQMKPRLVDSLWKYCRKKILGPAFLVNHPVFVSPLAKVNANEPEKVERFQVILSYSEMGNGYSELTDPIDQEERFKEQDKMREAGDVEAQNHDYEFVEAMEYGMPPICGFGFSERLFWMFEGVTAREGTMFPMMCPKDNPVCKNPNVKTPKKK